MASILAGSIDVTKIDKSKLDKGKYLNVSMVVNDEVGTYGDSGYIAEGQTQEEREAKADKNFLGNFKVVWTNGNNVDVAPKKNSNGKVLVASDTDDDLPF